MERRIEGTSRRITLRVRPEQVGYTLLSDLGPSQRDDRFQELSHLVGSTQGVTSIRRIEATQGYDFELPGPLPNMNACGWGAHMKPGNECTNVLGFDAGLKSLGKEIEHDFARQ